MRPLSSNAIDVAHAPTGVGGAPQNTAAPTLPILLALTVVTGIVDAVSFLSLGRVFTANMTGNVVLLGFALAGAGGLSVLRSSVALMGFFCGAIAGGRMARSVGRAFLTEASLLAMGAACALGMRSASAINPGQLYAVIALTAVTMGFRNAVVRKLGVPDLTTTVLTMTITGLAADSRMAGGNNLRWQRRCASIVAILCGAMAGARMVAHSISLPLFVCSVITAACALMQVRIDSKRRDS